MIEKKSKIDVAFWGAVLVAVSGFLLPLLVALTATVSERPTTFFLQLLRSNYAVSLLFCGIISLGLIWLSIPAYKLFTQLIKSKGVMPKSEETSRDAKACASEPEIAA